MKRDAVATTVVRSSHGLIYIYDKIIKYFNFSEEHNRRGGEQLRILHLDKDRRSVTTVTLVLTYYDTITTTTNVTCTSTTTTTTNPTIRYSYNSCCFCCCFFIYIYRLRVWQSTEDVFFCFIVCIYVSSVIVTGNYPLANIQCGVVIDKKINILTREHFSLNIIKLTKYIRT